MLPKRHRIPAGEIRTVLRRGRRYNADHLTVIVVPNTAGMFRCAIVVSSKFDKRAVRRNRIRRLLSESIRAQSSLLAQAYDMVLMPRTGMPDTLAGVSGEVSSVLLRAFSV